MIRRNNTTISGVSFDNQTIATIWAKARPSPNYPSYRQDRCGAYIKRDQYGTTEKYGWEIDHIKPVSRGGTDALNNLQPLHWQNNRHKGNDYPDWSCTIVN